MNRAVMGIVLVVAAVLATPGVAQARPTYGTHNTLCALARTPNVLGMSDWQARGTLVRHGFVRVYLGYQKTGVDVSAVTQIPSAGTSHNRCSTVTVIIGE